MNNKGQMQKKNYRKKIHLFLKEGRKREGKLFAGLLLKR
jgi:hypothetical protein